MWNDASNSMTNACVVGLAAIAARPTLRGMRNDASNSVTYACSTRHAECWVIRTDVGWVERRVSRREAHRGAVTEFPRRSGTRFPNVLLSTLLHPRRDVLFHGCRPRAPDRSLRPQWHGLAFVRLFEPSEKNFRSKRSHSSCYPIIYTPSGPCREVTRTILCGGARSRSPSRDPFSHPGEPRDLEAPHGSRNANERFGNVGVGNTPSATRTI